MKIYNRFDDEKVLFETDNSSLAGASLAGADLSGANLAGANLFRANLFRADLSRAKVLLTEINKIPLQLYGFKYPILITEFDMQIGCKVYSHSDWKKAKIEQIGNEPDYKDWLKYKKYLLQMCKLQKDK